MAGIYFHIPFCKRICGYCDFHRGTALHLIPKTIERMHAELEAEVGFLHDRTVRTIYFGGGTPSLLAPDDAERLIDHTAHLLDCNHTHEITIEVNPDDISPEYVASLRRTRINRVSIGVQSFDDECLRFMSRRHNAEQAKRAVAMLQEAGYDNISVDLIFGIEGFGGESLQRSIECTLALGIQHISAYHLTVEPATRFGRMLSHGDMRLVGEEQSESEFLTLHNTLTAAGFDHYEVSNYAKEGFRSAHNSSYWTGDEYLGIGAGAHSFNGEVRRWCEQPVSEYVKGVIYGEEHLTATDRFNEYIMTSLRRKEGISPACIEERFGRERAARTRILAEPLLRAGTLIDRSPSKSGEQLSIPPEKFLLSDAVISTFFEV